jgi:hypothetical protein
VKSDKTMVACAVARALQLFAEALACVSDSRAKILQPVVLPDLQGKGHVRKKPFGC